MSCSIRRYPAAFKASQIILNECKCSVYPIDIEKVITTYRSINIIVITETIYRKFRSETKQSRPYISIKDGRTYYDPNRNLYLVIYNDSRPKNRIRFTLAHEFAHIILGHLSDERTEIDRGGLPDLTYFSYEGAANTFSGNFLAPPIIIDEKLAGKEFISKTVASMFDISVQAAREYRRNDFLYWKKLTPSIEEKHVLARYKKRLITFHCKNCNYTFTIRNAKNCPICGFSVIPIRSGDDEHMGKIYSGVELDESGRSRECSVCANVEHGDDDLFCMICGKPIVNQCTEAINNSNTYNSNCEHYEPLPGNARYCPYCGSKTTFLVAGVLLEWNAKELNCNSTTFLNDINTIAAELPF